jgi:putative heme-binding domain-containing protein
MFAGGLNMLHLQQAGHFETILTHTFADANPTFRDLSWEADTVFRQGSVVERWRQDGFGDRDNQIQLIAPAVVIAQYGMLESMAGAEGVDSFVAAYNELIDAFQKKAKHIVLVTPTPFEKPEGIHVPDVSKHNESLALYVSAINQIADARELLFIDLFTDTKSGLTHDGMHISAESQLYIAETMAEKLGITPPSPASLSTLREAVIEKHRLWFDYWRPANWKLLFGDDSRRQFTKATEGFVPFREEWQQLVPLIKKAEERVWTIASGGADPGHGRPAPEVLFADPTADIEKELAAFTVAEGLKVNLFASEEDGLTSPLAIRWDNSGRMYVTVTTTYPHVFPGDIPNDKIIILEDTNGDGESDKSTLFADGLNIPTGMELGDGGVYVGQGTEILFLQDTDGDDKADVRRVLLAGFGTGDTHQTINSFVWSPDGELYMGQGDGIESRVETPWGSSDLYQAGFYRLRPRRLQLHPLLDDFMGPGNPWGVGFSDWGQIYSISGAGGVTHLSLGLIPAKRRLRLGQIGEAGGYCGITHLDGRHLPESFHGQFAIGDFQSNRVKCFSVTPDGAGVNLKWEEPLIYSDHRNFRPVDINMGPDGAVYVVDWYNPVICHQDDMYRDPTRDKAHGRIWRISSSLPTVEAPNLSRASTEEVVEALAAPERWTRYHAKREMTQRDASKVAEALNTWVHNLDPNDEGYEHRLYEAINAYATLEVVVPDLLEKLLDAKDPRARAFASRVTGRWQDRLDDPLSLLADRVVDEDATVRREAVAAAAAVPAAEAVTVVARAIERPMDNSMDYVFSQALHHLKPHWEPAHQRGELQFAKATHQAEVLSRAGSKDLLADLRKLANSHDLGHEGRMNAIATLISVGGPAEVEDFAFKSDRYIRAGEYDAESQAMVIAAVVKASRNRNLRPEGNPAGYLRRLMENDYPGLQAQAIALAGVWKVNRMSGQVIKAAQDESLPAPVRIAAFGAMADMRLEKGQRILATLGDEPHDLSLRAAAIEALVAIDRDEAGRLAVKFFGASDIDAPAATQTLTAFLTREGGARALTAAIQAGSLTPDTAKLLLRTLYATGRSDDLLLHALNAASGTVETPSEYSAAFVASLAASAQEHGDAARGAVQFTEIGCVACHKVGDVGGLVGPELTAIGTTLAIERIIEETLWPNRQIKEGFTALEVITNDFMIYQGYKRRTRESEKSGDLVIQDLTTQDLITIEKGRIDEQRETGSPMPEGLTTLISESQLFDLIRYLSELGKVK